MLDLEPVAGVWTLNVQPNCYSIHDYVDLTSTRVATHTAPARGSVAARSGAAQWLPPRLPLTPRVARVFLNLMATVSK